MHAIGEVNISPAGLPEHWLGALCPPNPGVTSQVVLPLVGFGFRDDACQPLAVLKAYQALADQSRRYLGGLDG